MKLINKNKYLSDKYKRHLKGQKNTRKLIIIKSLIRKAKYYDNQFKNKAVLKSYFENSFLKRG